MTTPLPRQSAPAEESLSGLRDRLDRIDDGLHRLIAERFEVVGAIAAAKGPATSVIRPEREADVITARLAADGGRVPPAVLAHVWRVLIGGACAAQRPFAVHTCGALDAARFLYGPVSMHLHETPAAAVRALADAPDDVAVLPETGGAWWQDRGPAHAIGRVPLEDGSHAVVLGGAGVSPGNGPLALVARNGAVRTTAEPDAADDVIGRVHSFPLAVPVAR